MILPDYYNSYDATKHYSIFNHLVSKKDLLKEYIKYKNKILKLKKKQNIIKNEIKIILNKNKNRNIMKIYFKNLIK